MSTTPVTLDPYIPHIGLSPTLQRPTLVLNRNWQPINNVATVARALIMLVERFGQSCPTPPIDYQLYDWERLEPNGSGSRQAVHPDVRPAHSGIPEVIALTSSMRCRHRRFTFSRRNVFKRDKMCCQYCGKQLAAKSSRLTTFPACTRRIVDRDRHCVLACKRLQFRRRLTGLRLRRT